MGHSDLNTLVQHEIPMKELNSHGTGMDINQVQDLLPFCFPFLTITHSSPCLIMTNAVLHLKRDRPKKTTIVLTSKNVSQVEEKI